MSTITHEEFLKLDPLQRRVMGALKLAMQDLGVPEHPAGECPESPCPCAGTTELVERRALLLLRDPGIDAADYCMDCRALIPLEYDSYAVDGGVVCTVCGEKRYGYQNDEYFYPGVPSS